MNYDMLISLLGLLMVGGLAGAIAGVLRYFRLERKYKEHYASLPKLGLMHSRYLEIYQFDLDSTYHNRCYQGYVITRLSSTRMLTVAVL